MDKQTLSQYGWSVITIMIIVILLGFATPFGNYIATSLRAVTFSLSNRQKEEINKYNTEGYVIPTDYLASEIEQIPTIYGIGRDDKAFVVATFNQDYTECTITKNGLNSNGAMMDFDNTSELYSSPLAEHSSTLKKVTIDYGVTNVGENLFEDCTKLIDVTLHSSVSDFGGENAGLPSWDSTIKSLTVYFNPEVDYSDIKPIIRKAIVLDGTTILKTNWFKAWDKIKEITLPESLITIEDDAFRDDKALSQIIIPNSVTSIGKHAFHGCENITSIQFPTGITSISEGCFWATTKLSHINIPTNVKRIEKHAFYTCLGLKSVILPDSIEYIGDYGFAQCRNLEKITLSNNLTTLGSYVFMGDKKITQITIPDSVKTAGNGILENCTSLEDVYISKNIKKINTRTFNNDSALKTVYFSDGVQQILDSFLNCSSLETIYIPPTVTTLSSSEFSGCPDTLIIQCKENSYAASWATSHSFNIEYV